MQKRRIGTVAAAVGGIAVMLIGGASGAVAQEKVTIFAAASLKNALDAVNTACEADVGEQATVSYAASSALAKQIEEGAPADVFMSADLDWMKYLSDKNLIKADTETKLLGNSIVLVAPADSKIEAGAPADVYISADLDWMNYIDKKKLVKEGTRSNLLGNSIVLVANKEEWTKGDVKIADGFPLAKLLGSDRLAMADVKTVPAGKYGKAALEKLGVWDSVSNKVAQAENVRAALALVGRGEAPLGIVYKTDAAADKNVKIIGTFPDGSHKPIIYPAAQLNDSKNPEAVKLLHYLASPEAKAIFEKHGFTALAGKPAA
jgi:molybdate transport system substrate-binding protein